MHESCKKAHEMLIKANEMLAQGKELTIQEMDEYNIVSQFCMNTVKEKIWEGYHDGVYGTDKAVAVVDTSHMHDHSEKTKHHDKAYYEKEHKMHEPKHESVMVDGTDVYKLLEDEAMTWVASMQNQDGTVGEHWEMKQTTAVKEQFGITNEQASDVCFYLLLNKKYSDNYDTAKKFNLHTTPDFFVSLAMDDINDFDAVPVKERLAVCYHLIRKK